MASTSIIIFFFLRAKKCPLESVWYDCTPVGRDHLKKFTEKMCLEAGISEKKTNHSLRATGASALFNAGVSERIIRDVTGHHLNALLVYERPSLEQMKMVSRVLVQGAKENAHRVSACATPVPASPNLGVQGYTVSLGSMFNNCTVTISPQNFVINNHVALGPIRAGTFSSLRSRGL